MSIFEIHNFTRYSTEDLRVLLEIVEAHVIEKYEKAEPAYFRTWVKGNGVLPSVIVIKDFVAKNLYRYQTVYSMTSKRSERLSRRIYVKPGSFHKGCADVRIVTPPQLWDTPIEALARCKESSVIPDGATEDILERFFYLYRCPTYSENDVAVVRGLVDKAPKVRILDSAKVKIDKEERVRAARERSRKAFSAGGYAIGKIVDYATSLDECKARGLNQLKRSKIPVGPEEERFAEAVRVLLEQIEIVRKAHACVTHSDEE